MATTYEVTTDSANAKNAEPTLTDSLDEALTFAERWAAEIVANLRNDFDALTAYPIDGGRVWIVRDGRSFLRSVCVREVA